MPTTPCNAPPGFFCSPLYNRPTICPENWYCAGGGEPARKCMDGSWSAVMSAYPEDCVDHWTVNLAVLFVLFVTLVVVSICFWYSYWDTKAVREGSFPSAAAAYGTYAAPRVVVFNRYPGVPAGP